MCLKFHCDPVHYFYENNDYCGLCSVYLIAKGQRNIMFPPCISEYCTEEIQVNSVSIFVFEWNKDSLWGLLPFHRTENILLCGTVFYSCKPHASAFDCWLLGHVDGSLEDHCTCSILCFSLMNKLKFYNKADNILYFLLSTNPIKVQNQNWIDPTNKLCLFWVNPTYTAQLQKILTNVDYYLK